MKQKIKIAVGMSGGVDSTITAFLLKKKGFDVIGLTMKIWDENPLIKGSRSGCYGPGETKDIADAKKAAKIIGIPHYVIDLRDDYQKKVIEYFKQEYRIGKTPNPCVVCNAKIKFGTLLEKALKSGIKFDYFSTGHYARIVFDKKNKLYLLKKGKDKNKDQSYFLYGLKQNQMKKTLLPLGDKNKKDIKKMAIKNGFGDFANKKESQNFIECEGYSTILPKVKPGIIFDYKGNVLGKHQGITNYTLGQRKNLNIGGLPEPYYVLKINPRTNSIIAGPRNFAFSDFAKVKKINWVVPFNQIKTKEIWASVRYKSKPAKAKFVKKTKNSAIVKFKKPQFAITPGQSIVFYDRDIVLGGGIIE